MTIATLHLLCSIARGSVYHPSDDPRIRSLTAKKLIAKAKQREWLIITPLGRKYLRSARSIHVASL